MVHSAYDSIELVKGCPSKIESVAVIASRIVLACSDAALRIYAPPPSPSDTPSDGSVRRQPYALAKTLVGFSKKPIVSMEVSHSRKLLISLSESIAFHRLPNLELVAVVSKSKGANAYAWDDKRGIVCFGRQKKVGIFRLEGGREFVEMKEFNIPDVVKSIAWCGENICLGIRREYMILNSTNGLLSEIFPSGRVAPPLIVPLSSGELLLGKDNIGVIVDQNGKLKNDGRICWSEAPSSVVIHIPYGIARLARFIEIRSLRAPYPLVQTVALRDVRLLFQSYNCAIAALENSVYGLLPVPLGAQIIQLTASGNFEEALALCRLLPSEDSNLRAAKESAIHIRYGHYLFDNASFEEAMEQFLASSVDITYVLSLYSSIVVPKSLTVSDPEKVAEFAAHTLNLSRGSSDASDEMESPSPSPLVESEEKSELELKKMSHNALMGLVKFLQKKRYGIIERATAEVTEEVVSDAVQDTLTSYSALKPKVSGKTRGQMHVSSSAREMATILDTALLQALVLTGQPSAALDMLKGPNYCDVKICEEFLRQRSHYSALLELYRYNEMHREALKLLNQLVKESNSELPQIELIQKFKPEMIIDYLKPLCATDPMLVLEFSMDALESCPTQTIELFLSGNLPADLVNSYLKQHSPSMQAKYLELMIAMNENSVSWNLQNELVQIYLSEVLDWYSDLKTKQKWDEKASSPTRKKLLSALEASSGQHAELLLRRLPSDALFEERAILLGKMNQHQLALSLYVHKLQLPELALSYCDRVYEIEQQQQHSVKSHSNIYLTLLQIYLNPRRTTKEFERGIKNPVSHQIFGTQKLVQGKVKSSRVAKKVVEIEGAEDRHINLSSTDSGRSEGDGDELNEERGPIMIDEVLDLLGRKWDRINGAQALKLLPRETKLQDLILFLEPLLKKSSEACRNFSVIRSLRHSENLQVKDELYKHRRAVVKITGDSMCSLCKKRIGISVFAVYPNGKTLVHFACFRDSQNIKAVKRTSLKRQG